MEEETVKLYLAEQVPFTLTVEQCNGGVVKVDSSSISWKVDITLARGSSSLLKEVSDKLTSAFLNRELECRFSMSCRKRCAGPHRRIATAKHEFRVLFPGESGCRLREVLGEEGAAFLQAEIAVQWLELSPPPPGRSIGSPILNMQLKQFETKMMKPDVEEDNLVFVDNVTPDPVMDGLAKCALPGFVTGRLNLILIKKGFPDPSDGEKMVVYKRMLEEELGADTIIVSSNGAEVKCHRGILAAHSYVFRAMFEANMQEARTRRIQMPDMSEEGVRAFLAYLYHWDLSKAAESCSVAVELLEAGHKYNVGILEEAMRKLLLSMPESWYDVDAALKMFLFVSNLDPEWEALRRKAEVVLERNSLHLRVEELGHCSATLP